MSTRRLHYQGAPGGATSIAHPRIGTPFLGKGLPGGTLEVLRAFIFRRIFTKYRIVPGADRMGTERAESMELPETSSLHGSPLKPYVVRQTCSIPLLERALVEKSENWESFPGCPWRSSRKFIFSDLQNRCRREGARFASPARARSSSVG